MKLISTKQAAELLSITRETAGKKLSSLVATPGPKGANLFPSDKALPLLLGLGGPNDGEFIDLAEAQRLLTVKRGEQIDLEMEVTRKERIPLEVLEEVNDRVFSNVAGMIKAHEGKTLTSAAIGDILGELRSIGSAVREASR